MKMFKRKNKEQTSGLAQYKPLRLWPGVVIVILQWMLRFVIPAIAPDALIIGVFAGLFGGLAVVLWWVFFSRASWFERVTAIVLMIFALIGTSHIIHVSIATGGQGMMFYIYAIPVLSLAFVGWAVATRNLANGPRRWMMVATILFACGLWTLLRSNGITGDFAADLDWRWAKTSEERLLSQTGNELITKPLEASSMETEAEWPGFRGRDRDGVIHGVKIVTDWSASPPVEIWRRSVGPGCSSFAVQGNLLYTQEQRGEYEMVTCYNLNTGEPVWIHSDSARFWDSHAGAGPRSTPTLSMGRVYSLGATGILNVLNAGDGKVVWSRNAASDTKVAIPIWGYTSSPLVVDSVVMVAIAGQLLAYDIINGNLRWSGTDGGESYSSAHVMTLDSIQQIVFLNKTCASSFDLVDGKVLWTIPWNGGPIIQPAWISGTDILISPGNMQEMQRITVKNGPNGWTTEERWKTKMLKPYFNDIVIHKGYIYGFEGPSLTCINAENGNRMWKAGRYAGEMLLLADQDLLLILSEKGEMALVMATPDQFKELSRFQAIKGKTWNHPVLVGNILVVRNSVEIAAFRLSLLE